VIGRIEKKKFSLDHSVIIGEDGGMYLLLNSLDENTWKIVSARVGDGFLEDK
jgi:hypothetical protein